MMPILLLLLLIRSILILHLVVRLILIRIVLVLIGILSGMKTNLSGLLMSLVGISSSPVAIVRVHPWPVTTTTIHIRLMMALVRFLMAGRRCLRLIVPIPAIPGVLSALIATARSV